jgi:hypothetical protein
MFNKNVEAILALLKPSDLVLDVGGWACPFNRANWVIDAQPYETRGFYEKLGGPKSQGPTEESYTKATWIERDICEKTPWPFSDKQFDFSICSQTLEDVRDPLYVCSELMRVSKRGYIEVPSRLYESSRGVEKVKIVGCAHHRWFVEIKGNHLQFTQKYHAIHGDKSLSFPPSFLCGCPKMRECRSCFGTTKLHVLKHTYMVLLKLMPCSVIMLLNGISIDRIV